MSNTPAPSDHLDDLTVAIAHKDYDVRGGGEVVAEELARTFDAPLYVGHARPENHPDHDDVDVREIAPGSRLHRLMDRTGTAIRGIAHMIHWRDHAPDYLSEYDVVVTSGNEPLWWQSRDYQTVIAFTHSTPRYMYDLQCKVDGFIGRTYNQAQRRLYEGRIKDVDHWVANSDLVARRIRKYWNIPDDQISVVYPPVPTHEYDPSLRRTKDYYLYLGRLAEHKRVGEVVRAFAYRDDQLRIAGKGPMRDQLDAQAGRNVTFEGYVSEQEKRNLYAGAKALIYPAQNEDFGMVPVEAMAAGTPVIGVREGFTRYQIREGKNGLLFERGVGELHDAITQFEREGVAWTAADIAGFAREWFGEQRFREEMRRAVAETASQTTVIPPWEDSTETPSARPQPGRPVSDGGPQG